MGCCTVVFKWKCCNLEILNKLVTNLTRALTALGFAVEEHVDKKVEEIESILTVVQRDDHSDADCLLVVMMTHGDEEGFLYDSQGWKFDAKKLWAPFTPDLCPTLAGKPKLFLVQACQGDQTDGVVKMSSNKSGGFSSYQLPNHADFLIATSTLLGKSSLRNTLTGSYFISAVCKVREEEFFPLLYFFARCWRRRVLLRTCSLSSQRLQGGLRRRNLRCDMISH